MSPEVRRRFDEYSRGKTTWDPVAGGHLPLVSWTDHMTTNIGSAVTEEAFDRLCHRMLSGHYYPPDAIECFGLWEEERREIRAGDRMLQRARIIPWLASIGLWSMTEVFVAERTATRCELGYVTTERHFGRGIWRAVLERAEGEVELSVEGTAGPASLWFWLGLPVARMLQRRAWRRAIEEFVQLARG